MTQDEIKEIIAKVYGVVWTNNAQLRDLTAFAKLAAEKEREACAKMCEDIGEESDSFTRDILKCTADAIRARGKA
jgi:hypothetical protein